MLRFLRGLFGGKSEPLASPKATTPDRQRLARIAFYGEVEAVLGELEHVTDVTRDIDSFALDVTTDEGETERAFLENVFLETREMSPVERRERLRVAFSSIGKRDKPETWEDARGQVMAVLRGATFGRISKAHMPETDDAKNGDEKPKSTEPIRRAFAPFVDIMVVIDRPTHMAYVSGSTLDEWKVGAEEGIDRALANLSELAAQDAALYDDRNGPLFVMQTGDSYESSRLLLPKWLASFRGKVEGDPIAIVPQRDILVVGGNARPEMIERLQEMAEKEFESSPRKVSCALYTVDADDRVVPYRSDAHAIRTAHERLALFEYTQQQGLLRESGDWDDCFVASYKVYAKPEGDVVSTAAWTKTVDSILPKVGLVMLIVLDDSNEAQSITRVPWEAVESRLTKVEGLHPEYYRTTGEFPSDAELADLRARYEALK